MEQRPLRLGDIVDDYCARERRVTNHAIVALVEDAIRQTRCTTCDAEHVYKGAKEPRLRKKPATSELDDRVSADVAGAPRVPIQPSPSDAVPLSAGEQATGVPIAHRQTAGAESEAAPVPGPGEGDPLAADSRPDEGGHAHRQLIRATLPRTENDQPAPRPIPEFTMHQRPPSRSGRGFRFLAGHDSANGNGNARNGFGQGRPGLHSGKRPRGRKRPR